MDWITISLLCVLEAALLLLVWSVVLHRKNTTLRRSLSELQRVEVPAPLFESIASGYFPYLEKQIIDTRSRLELSETETHDDDSLAAALHNRLGFLASEKRVVELCNDYPERRWEHVTECFRPPAAEVADCAATADHGADEAGGPADAAAPPDALSGQQHVAQLSGIINGQRDALQSFRQVFEVIRKEPDPQALEQMDAALRDLERRYREATTCIEIMERENERLHSKVDQGNRRLERAESEKHESIAELEGQVGKQKHNISELNHLIDGLQLEAEKAAELQSKLDQFDLATRDMNMCIQTMEEENEFLREQVQALLKMDQDKAADAGDPEPGGRIAELENELQSLQAVLKDKGEKIAATEAKLAAMEKEYLTLYEQQSQSWGSSD